MPSRRINMTYTEHFRKIVEEQLERVEKLKNSPAAADFSSMDKIVIGTVDGDGIGPIIMDSCRKFWKNCLPKKSVPVK